VTLLLFPGDRETMMKLAMAFRAEGDQFLVIVIAKPTSRHNVMNFQLRTRTAGLATPSVPPQHGLV